MPPRKKANNGKPKDQGITAITVQGFKSIAEETTIEIRPLTILAGANSSGKSSIMQPILMLKQTLEAPYDPGPLLINGPHVSFSSVTQFIPSVTRSPDLDYHVGFSLYDKSVENRYGISKGLIVLDETTHEFDSKFINIFNGIGSEDLIKKLNDFQSHYTTFKYPPGTKLEVYRNRCFYDVKSMSNESIPVIVFNAVNNILLSEILHIPGIRRIPENRYYPVTTVSRKCPGHFNHYVGGFVNLWQEQNSDKLDGLNQALYEIGVNSAITARSVDQVHIEILVSRLTGLIKTTKKDLVNIADVGFGVSQVLPVLVALLVAEPGQLVYIEQPELHLHPRAQVAMAEVLVDAAKRGVKVVAETHSSSLLLGIQTAVAEGKISPDLVILHWFERQKNGVTKVTSANLDEQGRFGDWPEDFGDVELKAQSRYLDASLKS